MRTFSSVLVLVLVAGCVSGCCSGHHRSAAEPTTVATRPAPAPVASTSVAARPAPVPESKQVLVSVEAKDDDLREVLDLIARQAGVNIVLDRGVNEKVTITLRNIPWREAVNVIAAQTRCEVSLFRNGVYFVDEPPRVTLTTGG